MTEEKLPKPNMPPRSSLDLLTAANIRYSGTISEQNGTIIEQSNKENTRSLFLERNISNPYPAKELINNANTVVRTEMTAELRSPLA